MFVLLTNSPFIVALNIDVIIKNFFWGIINIDKFKLTFQVVVVVKVGGGQDLF